MILKLILQGTLFDSSYEIYKEDEETRVAVLKSENIFNPKFIATAGEKTWKFSGSANYNMLSLSRHVTVTEGDSDHVVAKFEKKFFSTEGYLHLTNGKTYRLKHNFWWLAPYEFAWGPEGTVPLITLTRSWFYARTIDVNDSMREDPNLYLLVLLGVYIGSTTDASEYRGS